MYDIDDIDEMLADCLDDIRSDMDKSARKWAEKTRKMMFESAPYATGNLRESIVIDEELDGKHLDNIWAGVDEDKLLAGTPREAMIVNPYNPWKGMITTIPDENYVMVADDHNITANWGAGGPFVEDTWVEYARKYAKEVF